MSSEKEIYCTSEIDIVEQEHVEEVESTGIDKKDVKEYEKEKRPPKMPKEIVNIEISKIERSDANVRTLEIENEVMSLAKTMDDPEIGLQDPIQVRIKRKKISESGEEREEDRYLVVDGQRRVIAARILGWKIIPAIILGDDDKEEDDIVRSLIHDVEKVGIHPQDKARDY